MRVVFILLLGAISCESYDAQREVCTAQGFDEFNGASIQAHDKLRVSHVAYSTAEQVRIINGEIVISNESFPFTVVLDDQEVPKVLTATFPLMSIDSSEYQCSFRILNNDFCEICWQHKEQRIYLRKRITL